MNNPQGFVGNRMNFTAGRFPGPYENFRGKPDQLQQPNAIADGIGHYFDRLNSTDPEVVLNQVIPVIIRQAQENLSSGRLDPNQFSNLMRQVMQMKEQALMLQADKSQRNQSGQGPAGNWGPMNQPQTNLQVLPPPGSTPMFKGKSDVQLPLTQPPPVQPIANRDLPMASIEELDMISNDPVSTIDIDMLPRDIRYYGEMATVVMGPGDVRELSFNNIGFDTTRLVTIDEKLRIPVPVNSPNYVPFVWNGIEHRIRLGAPTREIWIDDKWYQSYFNETIRVQLGQTFHRVHLEGPPPNVTIGKIPLRDICLGTVQLIIDGDINYPVTLYLDAKPQRIDIAGKPHIFRFVEGIKRLLINGHPFTTHFGGMPMVVYVNQEKHYLRLTTLPEGVRPDRVGLRNLYERKAGTSPLHPTQGGPASPPMLTNENSMEPPESGSFENKAFDRILSMMPSPITPRLDKDKRRLTSQYSSSADGVLTESKPKPVSAEMASSKANSTAELKPETPPVDIHDLWSQLLGAGLVAGGQSGGGIPGLEAQSTAAKNVDPAPQEKKEINNTSVKSEKEVTPNVAAAATAAATKTPEKVETVKPVVLKSHHKSLKE